MAGRGQQRVPSSQVGDFESATWVEIFRDCCEWRWDGALLRSKFNKKQNVKTGFYSRVEWPEAGGYPEQPNLVVEVFRIVKDEENKIQSEAF